MPVNLLIKSVPDAMVHRLRVRAQLHHRSLQGELMAILEQAVQEPAPLSPEDVLAEVRRLGLITPRESAGMAREARDGR